MPKLTLPTHYYKSLLQNSRFKNVKRVRVGDGELMMAQKGDFVIKFDYQNVPFFLVFNRDPFQKRYRQVILIESISNRSQDWGSIEIFTFSELQKSVENLSYRYRKGV